MEPKESTKVIDKTIRDIHKYLVEFTKGSLRENKLTKQRFMVLWYIVKNQPVNMSYLHDKMYMANSTLTVIVDRLVEDKLLKRYRNPEDRREVLLELTKKGENILGKLLNIRQSFLERALEDLSDVQKDDVIELLSLVLNNLEDMMAKGGDNNG
ncbi:MAG: MarR family winged helix-turn-helix transcriptional regulator [Bacillota bacterium]